MPSMTVSVRSFGRAARLSALTLLAVSALSSVAVAQDFEFEDEPAKRSFGIQLGAQRALGDLEVFTERGLGFGIHARQPLRGSRIVSLRADLGFARFTRSRQIGGAAAGSTSFDNQFTSAMGLVGAQATADNETFRPYIHAGVGVGFASAGLTPTGPNLTASSSNGVGLAWMGGVGVYRLIGESDREWAFDVGARLLGMPGINQPSVRVDGTRYIVDQRNVTSAAWSFVLGVHFVP
jgi:hypothetical protein